MDRLPFGSFDDFAEVADPARYAPLPAGWVVGVTDVVRSTAAIAEGRYKAVNVAGAAAISAMMNALGTRDFPFAFGGDGCVFALPAEDAALARDMLAATAAWVTAELQLTLRTALVPAEEIRAAGADVRVALFRPSPHVAYAMFDGGGVALAEGWMKAGRGIVPEASAGTRPDLTGLSCRWLEMRARRGGIVSIIARAGPAGTPAFRAAVGEVLGVLGDPAAFHPVPADGAPPALFTRGLAVEARTRPGPHWRRLAAVALHNLLGFTLFKTGRRLGTFDPIRYRALTSANADTRKYGDALMLTADLDDAAEARVRRALDAAETAGALVYGIHRQAAAMMTCVVPSFQDDGHFHFVDGADGGYVAAATALKKRAEAKQPLPQG